MLFFPWLPSLEFEAEPRLLNLSVCKGEAFRESLLLALDIQDVFAGDGQHGVCGVFAIHATN